MLLPYQLGLRPKSPCGTVHGSSFMFIDSCSAGFYDILAVCDASCSNVCKFKGVAICHDHDGRPSLARVCDTLVVSVMRVGIHVPAPVLVVILVATKVVNINVLCFDLSIPSNVHIRQ